MEPSGHIRLIRNRGVDVQRESVGNGAVDHVPETFGSRIIDFYRHLRPPGISGLGVEPLFPYKDRDVRAVMEAFYRKFYGDRLRRVFIIGINPGRFGAGTTGVPFTDPVALESHCGISNAFPKRRELSAVFIEQLLDRFGGPAAFYKSFFITAASPVGFTRNGRNYNYYDDPELLAAVKPYIVKTMRAQLAFGARRDIAVVLGTGKNFEFLHRLNEEQSFFEKLVGVEHPRFIMQYRRLHTRRFLDRYESILRPVIRESPKAGSRES